MYVSEHYRQSRVAVGTWKQKYSTKDHARRLATTQVKCAIKLRNLSIIAIAAVGIR